MGNVCILRTFLRREVAIAVVAAAPGPGRGRGEGWRGGEHGRKLEPPIPPTPTETDALPREAFPPPREGGGEAQVSLCVGRH